MAHIEQIEYCKRIKAEFPEFFRQNIVLDVGSLDINGNNRYLFENCLYIGVDVAAGPNVDFVSLGSEFNLPDNSIDVVISTECFEHDRFYEKTLKNIIRMLKPGGLFVFTCATSGRPEHGTARTTPGDAPFLQEMGEWANYYLNLDENLIRLAIPVEEIFEDYKFEVNNNSCDLYFYGFKKGRKKARSDYSFISQYREFEEQLNSKFLNEISLLENEILSLRDEKLDQNRFIEDILASTSWRITAPMRKVGGLLKKILSKLG